MRWARKQRHHVEDLGIDGRVVLKCILKKLSEMVWTAFIWARIGNTGRPL
jgi:hypothetical protein